MKIDKVSVTYSRKFNLGDYNSLQLEATVWADLESSDNPIECVTALQDMVRDAVRSEHSRLKGSVGPNEQASAKNQMPEPEAGNPAARG